MKSLFSKANIVRGIATSTAALLVMSGAAHAALTLGALDVSTAAGSAMTLGVAVTTGSVGVATGLTTGSATFGSTASSSAVTIQSGTGDVTVTSTDDFIFTATDDIAINSGSTAGIINIGTSAFAQVLNLATNATGNTVNIGTDNTIADTIAIGSALDTTSLSGVGITIASGATDVTITSTDDFIFTATDDISINSGSTAGIINIGTSAFAQVLNLATNATGNTVNIGTNNTIADTITIGSALDSLILSSVGFNVAATTGATIITGAAEGTAALTLTAGDVVLTDGDVTVSGGNIIKSIQPGVTASIGSIQGGSPITADIMEVSISGTAGDSVTLPTAVAGATVTIINHGVSSVGVFPATGAQINEGGANLEKALAADATLSCYAYTTLLWECNTLAR